MLNHRIYFRTGLRHGKICRYWCIHFSAITSKTTLNSQPVIEYTKQTYHKTRNCNLSQTVNTDLLQIIYYRIKCVLACFLFGASVCVFGVCVRRVDVSELSAAECICFWKLFCTARCTINPSPMKCYNSIKRFEIDRIVIMIFRLFLQFHGL